MVPCGIHLLWDREIRWSRSHRICSYLARTWLVLICTAILDGLVAPSLQWPEFAHHRERSPVSDGWQTDCTPKW